MREFAKLSRPLLLLWLVVTMSGTGCSFVFVTGPKPGRDTKGWVDCSTSYAAPVLDMVLTVWEFLGAGAALTRSDADYKDAPISRDAAIWSSVTLTALASASAIYGATQVSHCREILEGNSEWVLKPTTRSR
jgi:hypothetical protein